MCSSVVYASPYGGNSYGSCTYQACPATTPVETAISSSASALDVLVNLVDNQSIPHQGYAITVMPSDNQGMSFRRVDFYVNGQLVQSQAPDNAGDVHWFWDPGRLSSAMVQLIVTGNDNTTVTKAFHVFVSSLKRTTYASTISARAPLQQVLQTPSKVIQATEHAVHRLPVPVKYSLPYILFVMLAVDELLLLVQIRREVRDTHEIQMLLERERHMSDLKKSFTQLVSHYIRTPLTIISGALDLLPPSSDTTVLDEIWGDVKSLKDTAETLVTQASIDATSAEDDIPLVSLWHRPMLYAPIFCVGLIAVLFDYLVQHNNSFSIGQANTLGQIVLFSSLTVGMYFLVRHLLLHTRETRELESVLAAEVDFNAARDSFVAQAASLLRDAVRSFDGRVRQLAPSKPTILLKSGLDHLSDIVSKFTLASTLHGSAPPPYYVQTTLRAVCAPAISQLQKSIMQKKLRVDITDDVHFRACSSELLSSVICTVLDNAIAYSSQGAAIVVKAGLSERTLCIAITDQGEGIPEDKKFRLFQAFSKVEGAEVFTHEGMGFSLYLDKIIMTYLHGDISITSTPSRGTTVTLTLPI